MKKFSKFKYSDIILLILLLIALPASYLNYPIEKFFLIALSIVATLPVVVSAFKSILNKKLSIDLLASVALIFSILAHQWISAVFINLMLTFSRIFLSYNEARARKNIEKLLKFKPKKIKIKKTDGSVVEINPKDVKVGDLVVVDLGERVPVDGFVISGQASLDESSITGESIPVSKAKSDKVFSSTLISSGNLLVKAEKIGSETTLEKIIKLVEEAQIDKPDIHTTAEKFTMWYLIIIFFGSIIALLISKDIAFVLAIMLVVCADDVAVAVPLTFLSAISYSAKIGVIVKGASFLEAIKDVKVIFVDKTGTLTKGKLKVENFVCESLDKAKILKYSGILAALSDHPISKAIAYYVGCNKGKGICTETPDHFQELSGKGITGNFSKDTFTFGKLSYLIELGLKIKPETQNEILAEQNRGYNTTVVSLNNEFKGYFVVADEIKIDIKDDVAGLKELGVKRIIMLTGDNENVAKRIAKMLGLTEYHSGLLPDQKLAFIKKTLSDKYKTMMVGDGINDAAALSLADVGVAMGAIGYDVTIESADVILMKDDFSKIPDLIRLSQYVMRISREDFFIWGATNIVGLFLVFANILKPTGAAAYNFLTDFVPLFNSTRIFKMYFRRTYSKK